MEFTEKKLKVLRHVVENGVSSIRDITRGCFPGVRPIEKGDSQTRNQLRTLVRDGYVVRKARGAVDATGKGRAATVLNEAAPKKKRKKAVEAPIVQLPGDAGVGASS